VQVKMERDMNKKLSCRRETARRFMSLNILLSHSRSFEMTLLSRARVSPGYYSIENYVCVKFLWSRCGARV